MEQGRYLTLKEVSEIFDLTVEAIRKRCVTGKYKTARKIDVGGPGGEQWMIHESEVNAAVEYHDVIPLHRNLSRDEFLEQYIHPVTAELQHVKELLHNSVEDNKEYRDYIRMLLEDRGELKKELQGFQQLHQQQLEKLEKELAATKEQLQQSQQQMEWATVEIKTALEQHRQSKPWWKFWG